MSNALKIFAALATQAGGITYVGGVKQGGGDLLPLTLGISGTLTGGIASSPSDGDLIVVAFCVAKTADETLSIKNNTSGGAEYTLAGSELYANDDNDTNLRVGYFVASSSTSVYLSASADSSIAVAVQVWRGVNQTTPMDVPVQTATGINSVLANPPAITPVTSGAKIIAIGAGAHDAGVQAYSSAELGYFVSVGGNKTNDAVVGMGCNDWTSGAFDPAAFAFSGADAARYSWAAVTLALRPA